jgi:hypothetical protein
VPGGHQVIRAVLRLGASDEEQRFRRLDGAHPAVRNVRDGRLDHGGQFLVGVLLVAADKRRPRATNRRLVAGHVLH